jgi:hypothetical protein
MALSAGEYISGGQVRDADGRRVVLIDASAGGEFHSGGQKRDADGRCVVVLDTGAVTA